MIAYLKGTVLEKGRGFVILQAGDVGYKVGLTDQALSQLDRGAEAKLYTHEVIREDSRELYGFPSMKELEFFWRLVSVSGVGPRMAVHLMSLGTVEALGKAIERGDVAFLAGAQGVGNKTAQRVVLELRGKLASEEESEGEAGAIVSALENLGYNRAKAREAAAAVPAGAATEEKIRAALKYLAKK